MGVISKENYFEICKCMLLIRLVMNLILKEEIQLAEICIKKFIWGKKEISFKQIYFYYRNI